MKVPYYCPYCDQRSTRRWNLDFHIKRRHGGYLGTYPPWYKSNPYHSIGPATVADSIGDTFQPGYIPQQASIGTSPSTIRPPLHTMDDQRNGGLSPGAILKIEQLRRLMNQHTRYFRNPDAIIGCATYYSIHGDNPLLDEWLERLHMIGKFTQ
jgi:hypothetical protein